MPTTYKYTITEWSDDGTMVSENEITLENMNYTAFPIHDNAPSNPFGGMAYINSSDGKLQIYVDGVGWKGVAWELI